MCNVEILKCGVYVIKRVEIKCLPVGAISLGHGEFRAVLGIEL